MAGEISEKIFGKSIYSNHDCKFVFSVHKSSLYQYGIL